MISYVDKVLKEGATMMLSVHDGRKEEMVLVGDGWYSSHEVTRSYHQVNQLNCYEQKERLHHDEVEQ